MEDVINKLSFNINELEIEHNIIHLNEEEPVNKLIKKNLIFPPILNESNQIYNNITQNHMIPEKVNYIKELIIGTPIAVHKNRRFLSNNSTKRMYDVFIFLDGDNIVKVYNYLFTPYSQYSIIKEIAFQKYARTISSECNFDTPVVLDYGNFEISN